MINLIHLNYLYGFDNELEGYLQVFSVFVDESEKNGIDFFFVSDENSVSKESECGAWERVFSESFVRGVEFGENELEPEEVEL